MWQCTRRIRVRIRFRIFLIIYNCERKFILFTHVLFSVAEEVKEARNSQGNIYRLVEAYRQHGHKLAAVNPISIKEPNSER